MYQIRRAYRQGGKKMDNHPSPSRRSPTPEHLSCTSRRFVNAFTCPLCRFEHEPHNSRSSGGWRCAVVVRREPQFSNERCAALFFFSLSAHACNASPRLFAVGFQKGECTTSTSGVVRLVVYQGSWTDACFSCGNW